MSLLDLSSYLLVCYDVIQFDSYMEVIVDCDYHFSYTCNCNIKKKSVGFIFLFVTDLY